MIYSNNSLTYYNTNLILENCVSKIQKEQTKSFLFNNNIRKEFFNLVTNLVFLLKYKIIILLNKIYRVTRLLYFSKMIKNVTLKFYNQFFLHNTISIPKIIKLDNNFLATASNLNFFFNKNNAYSIFNFQTKKINFKLFKNYKKKKKKKLSVVKRYWNNVHRIKKNKKKKKRLIYSWLKKKFVKSKTSFFYIYPSALWNFFKWTKCSHHIKPLAFLNKFKFSFNYKIKFFSKSFYLKNFNSIKTNLEFSFVIPKKKNVNDFLTKKSTYLKFHKKKYKKKLKKHKLIKFFFYINTNLKSILYISSYKYNPFFKKTRKFKKRTYKRQLRCRKCYKKYFSRTINFIFFCFNKNFNKKKILNYFYKLKNEYYVLCSIYKPNIKKKKKITRILKYRNQLYVILSKILKQLYFTKTINIYVSYNNSISNANLYRYSWTNLIFFHYLKIKIFKYKYLIKYLYKNNELIKKTKISLKFFYKILNNKVIFNLSTSNLISCNILFIKYLFNNSKLQSKSLILY